MTLYAPAAWWPGAVRRPVSYAAEAGPFTAAPLGWIPHVTDGYGSPYGGFQGAPAGARKFSHLFAYKNGQAEQYGPLDYKSWAQAAGNGLYYSFETEGRASEPYTDPQLDTLARFHVWIGAPDTLAATPGQWGIGTHAMGGAAWGGHTCPDPREGLPGPRSHQRAEIIRRAQLLRGGDDMPITSAEITAIASATAIATVERLTGRTAAQQVHEPGTAVLDPITDALTGIWGEVRQTLQIAQGLQHGSPVTLPADQVAVLAQAIVAAVGPTVASAVAAEMARRLARS